MLKRIIVIIFLLSATLTPPVFADYVLPYPSFMPGHKLYKVSRFIDEAKKYWYWGKIGQRKYHTRLSDKYLVEAKTLFEYKQYLLAIDALDRSSVHFKAMGGNQLPEESLVHIKVLEKLKNELPATFNWAPEKKAAEVLNIRKSLEEAITARR